MSPGGGVTGVQWHCQTVGQKHETNHVAGTCWHYRLDFAATKAVAMCSSNVLSYANQVKILTSSCCVGSLASLEE